MLKWNGQRNLLNYVRVQSIVPVELDASLHILLRSNSEVPTEYPHPLRCLIGNFFWARFYIQDNWRKTSQKNAIAMYTQY